MTVKKIIRETTDNDLKMRLSSKLNRVREAITQLPPDEGDQKMNTKTQKETRKTASANGTKQTNGTSLADICKGLRMEPRTARRILRNAEFPVEGSRWVFNAKQADRARKLLEQSQDK